MARAQVGQCSGSGSAARPHALCAYGTCCPPPPGATVPPRPHLPLCVLDCLCLVQEHVRGKMRAPCPCAPSLFGLLRSSATTTAPAWWQQGAAVETSAAQLIVQLVNQHPGQVRKGTRPPRCAVGEGGRAGRAGFRCRRPFPAAIGLDACRCPGRLLPGPQGPPPRHAMHRPLCHRPPARVCVCVPAAGVHPGAGAADQHCAGAHARSGARGQVGETRSARGGA